MNKSLPKMYRWMAGIAFFVCFTSNINAAAQAEIDAAQVSAVGTISTT